MDGGIFAALVVALSCLPLQAFAITLAVSPGSRFCFYEDVSDTAVQSSGNLLHARLEFTVLRGGKYREIAASVLSHNPNGKWYVWA